MPILGFGIAFLGYSALYYGLTQIQGLNYGFLDLMIPGQFAKATGVPPDATATTTKPGAYGAVGQSPAQATAPAGTVSSGAASAAAGGGRIVAAPAVTSTGGFTSSPGTITV